MSVHAPAQNAYGDATRAIGTPRGVEYQVFSQINGQLSRALRAETPFADLVQALHENLRLWTVIVLDVTQPENELPAQLRGQLASLAEFIRGHTQSVLRREAEPGVLVDINTAVMRGLRGQLPGQGA